MNKLILTALAALSIGASTDVYAQSNVDALIKQCARLYVARNNFYNERGLCFTRPGAMRLYPDNAITCRYRSSQDLPIAASEKRVIDQIVSKEESLGCKYVRP